MILLILSQFPFLVQLWILQTQGMRKMQERQMQHVKHDGPSSN